MLEEAGVIARYVAVLDQRAVGLPVSVFVSIKLEKPARGSARPLRQGDRALAGGAGMLPDDRPARLLLRVVVADLAAYERFLKQKLTRLDGIASIESSFALEQVKYTNSLPIE